MTQKIDFGNGSMGKNNVRKSSTQSESRVMMMLVQGKMRVNVSNISHTVVHKEWRATHANGFSMAVVKGQGEGRENRQCNKEWLWSRIPSF